MEFIPILIFYVTLVFILPIVAIVIGIRNRRMMHEIAERVKEISRLSQMMGELRREVSQLRQRLDDLPLHSGAKPPAPETPAVTGAAPVLPPLEIPREPVEVKAPIIPKEPEVPIPPQMKRPPEPPRPAAVPTPAPRGIIPAAAPPPPPAPPRPPAPPVRTPPPLPRKPRFDWEGLIGVKLFSWIAGVALLIAAIFFLRYSIDRGWLTPPVQLAIGVLVGVGLLVLCELKAARKYPVTANAMDGSAIAILFATFFAARALWHLLPAAAAFALLILVTVIAVLLSIRRDSLFIALLGLLGGFSTPALLSTGENRPIPLFSYLLLLNAGLATVARKKNWPALTAISLVFTTLYQWGWVMKFLTSGQLPLAIGIFLIFPILTFVGLAVHSKQETNGGEGILLSGTANVSAFVPLLFAVMMASVPAYGVHYALLFGFLFLIDVGFLVVAATRGPELLHVGGGLSTILVFAIWLMRSYQSSAWPGILAFVALFVFFYLVAPWVADRIGGGFWNEGEVGVYAAPLLLFVFTALLAIEPLSSSSVMLFGTLFLLIAAAAVFAIVRDNGKVYFLSAFFGLVAEAVWSARYLTPNRLIDSLALYAGFGLLYIFVPAIARRAGKPLQPANAGAGLILASLGLLSFLATGPMAQVGIWGIALLLLVLNTGLFLEGTRIHLPVYSTTAIVLSWIILGVLWASTSLAAILVPALVVVAGYALVVMAGSVFLQREAERQGFGLSSQGIFLGLAGHLFLLVVASNPSLSIPPWPMLGVLLVMDLAIGAAVLYLRRPDLHILSMIASQIILIAWTVVAGAEPWPRIGILSAAGVLLMSLVWIALGTRADMQPAMLESAAVVTAILTQVIVVIAQFQPGAPSFAFILASHVILAAVLLVLAWLRNHHWITVVAVIAAACGGSLWIAGHAGREFQSEQFLLASALYIPFLIYPLLVGRRAISALEPYLAAVLASVIFFFQARHAMILAGMSAVIGILPVTQALLMAGLLPYLLKLEPAGVRRLGRLALVAGAALAFITVAIPLQLEKEWITLGWALEGAALAWLLTRIPHRGLLWGVSGLMTAVFVRLALNPSVLEYQPRGGTRIWNWYLYTYLVCAAAMIIAGWLLTKTRDELAPGLRVSRVLPGGGAILLFLLLNIEIADYYSVGRTVTFNFSATLAQDLTYTLGWALFAVGLLATGIAIKSQAARISAIALLVGTIGKCFLHDLARLGGLYRVVSFVGLAVCLALVAMALQKFVLSPRKEEK